MNGHTNRTYLARRACCIALVVPALVMLAGCPSVPSGGGGGGLPTACNPLMESFTTDTTLSAACYTVEADLLVNNGATLTIMPGVTLKFAQNAGLTVESDGRLNADGTAEDPILLTGEEAIRGYWDGLRFYLSNSTTNVLDHVTIEYGGGYWDANLYLDGRESSPARVAITNTTLRQSSEYGLQMNGTAITEGFANNTMTQNASGAAEVGCNLVGYLDDSSSFSGNDTDIVHVMSGTVDASQTWAGIDAAYAFSGNITVDADLAIDPGAQLVFMQSRHLTVAQTGSLRAVATAANPILFTGEQDVPGAWGGLRYYMSNSTNNRLEHVIIENGGGYWDANLYLDGRSTSPARVDIVNTTLRGSGTLGLILSDANVGEFHDNTITENTEGAARMYSDMVRWLDDTSTYSGNDDDVVIISGSTVDVDATWPGINVPYRIEGNVGVNAALTIDPGARVLFASAKEMTINQDGRLTAVGTPGEPIEFNGVQETPGYWGGLRFYMCATGANTLEYVIIANGGGYWDANLTLDGRSTAVIQIGVTNCTISNSGSWGIQYWDSTVNGDLDTANTFSGNTDGDINAL